MDGFDLVFYIEHGISRVRLLGDHADVPATTSHAAITAQAASPSAGRIEGSAT